MPVVASAAYVVPADRTAIVRRVVLANGTAGAIKVALGTTGLAVGGNLALVEETVPANSVVSVDTWLVFPEAASMVIVGAVAGVRCSAFGALLDGDSS